MQHIIFTDVEQSVYSTAILLKTSAFNSSELERNYMDPLVQQGIPQKEIIAFSLDYNEQNKAPITFIKETLQNIFKACKALHVSTLFVTDGSYFKALTKEKKVEPNYGYVKDCKLTDQTHLKIILSVNYQAIYYNPDLQQRLTLSLTTLVNHLQGKRNPLGANIIHSASYAKDWIGARKILQKALTKPFITCDIETEELPLSRMLSIAFGWDKHNGGAFLYDTSNAHTRILLSAFFRKYKGTITYHNASFDIKQLIFNLFMNKEYNNYAGAIEGIHTMFKKIHDTKLITYLAYNSTKRNNLSLKYNAFEFTGNYTLDDEQIQDMASLDKDELLEYNLIDTLATHYVFDKNMPKLIQANQLSVYENIFLPSLLPIVLIELTGLPLDIQQVSKAWGILSNDIKNSKVLLEKQHLIQKWGWEKQLENFIAGTAKLKTKINPIEKYDEPFNPNSDIHLQEFFYEFLGLEITDTTNGGKPATGAKTLTKLKHSLMNEFNITEAELL